MYGREKFDRVGRENRVKEISRRGMYIESSNILKEETPPDN